ncbi:MAG: DUF58 domain-containing protein [Gammaproteobacteria bacterium]|nr:DUF58 domain-containing protein [Gammaproteobacteria bacterium]
MAPKLTIPLERLNLNRFFEGEGPFDSPLTLTQRRIFILPTRQGLFFGLLLVVMLLGAINYDNSMSYLLTFLLASLIVVSILHTFRNLLHLRISVAVIAPVFSGENVTVPIILDNTGYPSRFAIRLELPKQAPRSCDVANNNWTNIDLSFPTKSRGKQSLPRITISTVFPLGLFRAWSPIRFSNNVMVYPAPLGETRLPYHSQQYQQRLDGGSQKGADDFTGFRNYHSGDSLRHINWKAYARQQELHTKQFGSNNNLELWLDWRTLPETNTETKLSQLCKWVIEADKTDVDYGLWLPNTVIKPGDDAAHKQHCLEALALFANTSQ